MNPKVMDILSASSTVESGELANNILGQELCDKKRALVEKVFNEITNIMVARGEQYSALNEDIFSNFRSYEDITFLVLTQLKLDRLHSSVLSALKGGNTPSIHKVKDHILDQIGYLILYYGFLEERNP